MASIDKVAKGRWRVRWRQVSGRERSRTVRSRAAADELVREVEHKLALGQDWQAEPESSTPLPSLLDQVEAYIRHEAPGWARGTVRVRTDQLGIWLEWAQRQGHEDISALTGEMLLAYRTWLSQATGRHGAVRKQSTQKRLLRVVELFWSWSHDWDEANQVRRPRRVSHQVRAAEPAWRPAPTWEEMRLAIAAATGLRRDLLITLYYTGLRVQQALALQRADVDLWRGELLVRPELGKTTAEQAGRIVPLSPHFVAWARELPEVEGGWLLGWMREDRKALSKDAVKVWERSGVRPVAWTGRPYHCFRAGFISGLKRSGADLDDVEVLVGHKPVPTAGAYLDPDAVPLRSVVARIPSHDITHGAVVAPDTREKS